MRGQALQGGKLLELLFTIPLWSGPNCQLYLLNASVCFQSQSVKYPWHYTNKNVASQKRHWSWASKILKKGNWWVWVIVDYVPAGHGGRIYISCAIDTQQQHQGGGCRSRSSVQTTKTRACGYSKLIWFVNNVAPRWEDRLYWARHYSSRQLYSFNPM